MSRFNGKVAYITGGASGIGFACAELLVKEGAKIVIADLNSQLAQEKAEELGNAAACYGLNVADPNSVQQSIKFTEDLFGGLDLAINAAGIAGEFGPLADTDPSGIERVIQVNLLGTAYCNKYEVLAMQRRGGGAIVNISSAAGVRFIPYFGAYSASKAAISTLTSTTASESGPASIRINCVAPGYIDTPLLGAEVGRDWAASVVPLNRCGLPTDIADSIAFLLSDAAKHITGTTLTVDGGLCSLSAVKPPGFGKTTLD